MKFEGVMPAITTPFNDDLSIDHEFIGQHVNWLVDHGCTGIVPLGSLGEGNTLRYEEKVAISKDLCRCSRWQGPGHARYFGSQHRRGGPVGPRLRGRWLRRIDGSAAVRSQRQDA